MLLFFGWLGKREINEALSELLNRFSNDFITNPGEIKIENLTQVRANMVVFFTKYCSLPISNSEVVCLPKLLEMSTLDISELFTKSVEDFIQRDYPSFGFPNDSASSSTTTYADTLTD